MNRLSVLILILAVGSVSMVFVRPYKGYPRSCLHIKRRFPRALSGLYDIAIGNTAILKVYCEMAKYGGGFTFIPRDAVRKGKLRNLVNQLFIHRSQVLLRFQKNDGRQPYTLIRQLPGRPYSLGVKMHNYNGYTKPLNHYLRDYLYLGILPATAARRRRSIQGFRSNRQQIKFRNCDANPNSYFVFFPNHHEQAISNYHGHNLVYERRGVAVDWRRAGVPSYGHRQMPNDFFFLTEMHFGGCGCYTSSDRWTDAHGTAIGLR